LQDAQAAGARVAAIAELQAIILRDLNWTFPEKNIPGGLLISIGAQFGIQVGSAPGSVHYRVSADLSGAVPDHGELFQLHVTYQLVFSVPEGEEFSPTELEGYGSATVLFMAFPYVRHALQDMAGRAGLPPLLLAPLRLPFGDIDAFVPTLHEQAEAAD
jgi:preprotein translocase subunit SecB